MLKFIKERGVKDLPMYSVLVTDEEYKYFVDSDVKSNI
jgi:hypothetical protein